MGTGRDRHMEPDSPQANPTGKLRLIDLRAGADRPNVHFAKRLGAILTEPGSRTAAARAIALTVAGPRPDDADGSVEVGGDIVSVRTLPSPLVPAGAPVLVDEAVFDARWQAWCARRCDELAIAHASGRLERHRIDAALEQAQARPPAPMEPEAEEPSGLDAAPEPGEPDSGDAELRARVGALLQLPDGEEMPRLPEGQLLADAWDAHAVLVRACAAVDEVPGHDLAPLEQRVDDARKALAELPSSLPEEVREHIERSHQAVEVAEKELIDARRRQRKRAVARYEEAVAIELVALADTGIESYASFLALVAAAQEADAGGRAKAEAELSEAREALDQARLVRDVPTRRELAEREALMRDRATELLGHPPGADPAAELRELRLPFERSPEAVEAIAAALRDGGIASSGDVIAAAEAFLADEPVVEPVAAAPPPPDEPATAPDEPDTPVVDIEELEALDAQRRAHDRELAEIEGELAALGAVAGLTLAQMDADGLARAIDALFADYRAGSLLNGTLPVVFDGILDGIARDSRERAIELFAGADDIQIVVVSDDPEVLQSLAYAGAALVRWPEPATRSPSARSST